MVTKTNLKKFLRVLRLGDVAVRVLLSVLALKVFLLDENVDALFDDLNFRLEAGRELVEDFGDELSVVEDLAHLHDANDGGLDEHFAVLFDVLVGHFLFSLLLGLQREVDVDAEFFAENFNEVSLVQLENPKQSSSPLEQIIQRNLSVRQQLLLVHIALQQVHLEEDPQDLLQVFLAHSFEMKKKFFRLSTQ